MKLIGNYLSPYARRIAITLHELGTPFEFEEVFIFKNPEAVRPLNPLTRIPALVRDDGEVLIESAAILDAIDEEAGPERAMVPPAGKDRRHALKLIAVAIGAMEKAQWAFYEGRFRPAEIVHQPWIDHNESQVVDGLTYLDQLAQDAGPDGWLAGTPALSQVDITAAVAFSFIDAVRPGLAIADKVPALAAFAARCEARDSFRAAPIPPPAQ
jgi:glutathione S-transferase